MMDALLVVHEDKPRDAEIGWTTGATLSWHHIWISQASPSGQRNRGDRRKMAEMPPSFPSTVGCVSISPRGGCISLWTSRQVLSNAAHPKVPRKQDWAQRSQQDLASPIWTAAEILSHCGKNLLCSMCFVECWSLCRSSQVCKDVVTVLCLLLAHGDTRQRHVT